MKRIAFHLIISTAAMASACASGPVAMHQEVCRTVAWPGRNCIHQEISGVLPASFDTLARFLSRPGLVRRIQTEYCRLATEDKTPTFSVIDNGDGTYRFINGNKRRTDVAELYRRQTSDSTYDMAYHAAGKSFFGKYEVLVRIRLIRADPAGTVYIISVSAYPHNGTLRFLARRSGLAERYLQRKIRNLCRISEMICRGNDDPLRFNPLWYPLAAAR